MENNWKAWLIASAFLTATTGLGTTSAFAATTPNSESPFIDLNGISPEQTEAIREAARLGLITGFPNNEYRPQQALTRQEFAILLVKALNLPVSNVSSSPFKDVNSSTWSLPYIEAARQAGLMTGSGSNFRPQAFVSREEMASVLVRAINGQNVSGGLSIDTTSIGPVSEWARNSIESAARLGLVESSFTNLNLKGNVTRADIAPFLVNIFPEKETTATVTSVSGDTIMIDNKPLLVTPSLKQLLLAGDNIQALEGAILKFKSARHSVNDIGELEIVTSGTAAQKLKLDASGLPSSSILTLSGNQIAVTGSSISTIKLQKSASNIELNAKIGQLQIDNAGALDLTGTASFDEVRITNANAKVTIGPNVQINRIVIPSNTAPSTVIANLSQASSRIKQAVSSTGALLPLVSSPVSTPAPAPTSTPSDPVITQPADPNVLAVEQDLSNLMIGFVDGDTADNVRHSIILPLVGAQGSAISWVSDQEDVLSANGTVTRSVYGSNDTPVTLKATLTKGSAVRTKDFALTVKASETPLIDKTVLQSKVNDAELLISLTTIGSEEGQVPQEAFEQFELAILAAKNVLNDTQADQPGINLAAGALDTATSDFEQAIFGVSKQLLNQKIVEAQSLLDNAVEGEAEGNVPVGTKILFAEKIQDAKTVADDSNATKESVKNARIALSQEIELFNQSKVVLDKTNLLAEINTASAALANTVSGYKPGQVVPAKHDLLSSAVQSAQDVYGGSNSTQSQINASIVTLKQAVEAFNQAKNPELTMTIVPGAEFILNNTLENDDVKINDNALENGEATYEYTKRSILNYVRVANGNEETFLSYDSSAGGFRIYADSDFEQDTGRVLTVTSTSTEINVEPASSEVVVSQNGLSDNTTAVLEFNLMDGNTEIADVKVPIREDHQAPTWTGGTYADGKLTLSGTEKMLVSMFSNGYTVYYSATGSFGNGDETLSNNGNISSDKFDGNNLVLTIDPSWLSGKGTLPPGSKFRVVLSNYTDYGNNVAPQASFDIAAGPVVP